MYDKLLNRPERDDVLLFNLKRNEILPYVKEIVRPKLRNLVKVEFDLIDFALDRYFLAWAVWSEKQNATDSEEIGKIKRELAREEERYFRAHAADRFKTEEDWAIEYLESSDPNERETGRMLIAQLNAKKDAAIDARDSDITRVIYDSPED